MSSLLRYYCMAPAVQRVASTPVRYQSWGGLSTKEGRRLLHTLRLVLMLGDWVSAQVMATLASQGTLKMRSFCAPRTLRSPGAA